MSEGFDNLVIELMTSAKDDHHYISAACVHDEHHHCDSKCSFCKTPCLCKCHTNKEQP